MLSNEEKNTIRKAVADGMPLNDVNVDALLGRHVRAGEILVFIATESRRQTETGKKCLTATAINAIILV